MASKSIYTLVAVAGIAVASGAAWWLQKPRQAEGTVDQGIGQKAIGGDGGERDRQRRLRTIDGSHEIAKSDEAPGRDHRPRQSGEVARGQRGRLG